MKKSKSIALILTPILSTTLLTACGDEPADRDVYKTREECVQDWGDQELCEPMRDDDDYHRQHGVHYPLFYGPHYYGSDRAVHYNGREIRPVGRSTTFKSVSRPSSSFSSSKSSPVSRGGFGGRGISSGS